jgi:exonuclease VII small subunit
MDENPDRLPLVERFHRAEHLARELSEHLRQAFLPRLAELRTAGKIFDVAAVTDQELFDRMQALLQAEQYARELHDRLQQYLKSIEQDSDRLLNL